METSIEKIAELAQDQLDREAAKDPVLKNALVLVEKFIKNNRVMCYGGTAINNLLPEEDRFYDPNKDIPDYDFFSETPQEHAIKIADQLTNEGYASVEVKPGVHMGTFKVFADYTGVADISHLDKAIFERLWKDSIVKNNIHYVPPNFLRMSVYLELSRPKGDVSRWKKVYTRLMLLNKHYHMTCPSKQESMTKEHLTGNVQNKIEEILINEKVVLLGFNASTFQKRGSDKWMLPLDILCVPEKRQEIANKLEAVFEKDIKRSNIPPYGELLPGHTDLDDAKTKQTLIRIYDTDACYSYHETGNGLMVASIPTLLRFFLSVLYAPKHFLEELPEQRFLCTAQHLVEMANNNLPRRYKLLTPISCIGKQKSLIDMRSEKSEIFEKLSKDRNSREFLEYFFTYTPTSLSRTERNKVRKQINKTFRKKRFHQRY
jgi:hypothetical protein